MTTPISQFAFSVALASVLASATASWAETITFRADLKASSEVPPNDSKGSGLVTATYDSSSKKLSYNGNYSGLTGPATAAHFHGPAEPGNNAGVQVPVPTDAIVKSPFDGEATLTDAQASDLVAGKWYFNIHTAANKGGEIRGQIQNKYRTVPFGIAAVCGGSRPWFETCCRSVGISRSGSV